MSDKNTNSVETSAKGKGPDQRTVDDAHHRTFLCVVDSSAEMGHALKFACYRADNTNGRVALLYVMQPAEFQHWMAIGDRMRMEAREEAEELLQVVSALVQKRTGHMPVCYIREGSVDEEVVNLLDEDEHISLLVLGAASGTDGPGPLVSYLVEKMTGKLRVPVTIVPGNLTDDQIAAIT